jgi:hypothetical protein
MPTLPADLRIADLALAPTHSPLNGRTAFDREDND